MSEYKVGIVGAGAVGAEMVKILRERKFPASELHLFARTAREATVAGETFQIQETELVFYQLLDCQLIQVSIQLF